MTTKRWYQDRETGELIPVDDEHTPEIRQAHADSVLWNDRNYQDMGDPRFSSRTQHRDYMKAKGLTTADDFKGQWRESEKKRIESRQGRTLGQRRAEIVQSIQKLNAGYKPNIQREE